MKHSNKTFSGLLLSFLMLLPMAAHADNLISIIVCDTKADSIGASVEKDFANMQKKTAEIAKYTKMKEVKVHLRGSEANPQRLNRILDELKVTKNDVVVFYYAGHGYHPSSQKKSTPWPTIIFETSSKSVSYDGLIKDLERKKPRLLLALADTCNSLSRGLDECDEIRATSSKVDSYVLEHNYKKLFLETSGSIKITGCSVGESSWGGRAGGVFTVAFLSKLNKAVESHNGIDWRDIVDEVSRKTTQDSPKNSKQHPYYELKIKS
jgi:hypothetical protein